MSRTEAVRDKGSFSGLPSMSIHIKKSFSGELASQSCRSAKGDLFAGANASAHVAGQLTIKFSAKLLNSSSAPSASAVDVTFGSLAGSAGILARFYA